MASTVAVAGPGHQTLLLNQGWESVAVPAGSVSHPSDLVNISAGWMPAQVPGTFASALRAAGMSPFDPPSLDASDHWFRCLHPLPDGLVGSLTDTTELWLQLDGLATLADVYWNDDLLLSSDNMFLAHRLDLSTLPRNGRLHIRFHALAPALAQRRPRPRWRTRLVEQQQLRWLRTTLLGRIPGWSPPVAPVGPFRVVSLQTHALAVLEHTDLSSRVQAGDGIATVRLSLRPLHDTILQQVTLQVGEASTVLTLSQDAAGRCQASGSLQLGQPALWWPHTHGTPARYPVKASVATSGGTLELDLGWLGFREMQVDTDNGAFAVQVNGTPVFCRGACWTPVDMVSLDSSEAALRPTLTLARDAGMNMLRVGGTMVYESQAFYDLCDELGILVWQDFMFANMDYPVDDAVFASSIATEARQFLNRTQSHACIAVLCGNSEIEQQAAMLGLARDMWCNRFFADTLPALCAEHRPDARYWPSSPSGGVLPFQVDHAVSHYYGVGAYLRPLEDARRAGVRFTSECLGFSNVPDDATIDGLLKNGEQPFHHPAWKQRVPRDGGAGWDFEDVRDHYMAQLFQVEPMRLRYSDMPRYLALARVTTGEVIAQTLAEWRRAESPCQGALLWFLRDLWPGAGWGLIDATGLPKAAYWYARRAMAPLAVFLSDEGLNGLVVHLVNDGPAAFSGELALGLYRHFDTSVAQARQAVAVPAHGSLALRADALFEHFLDTSYAYRFGPAGHHVAVASLYPNLPLAHAPTQPVAEAFHFPLGLGSLGQTELALQASFEQTGDEVRIVLASRKLAQSVFVDVPGYRPEDNYFHIAPGATRSVRLQVVGPVRKLQGTVHPLNSYQPQKILPAMPPAAPA